MTEAVFAQALAAGPALSHHTVETLERIAWFCMSQGDQPLPEADVDESFRQRPAYQEGCLTDEPDLSIYDDMPGR